MATTTWSLEPMHAELNFKVRHMMISNVSGHFSKIDATVETDGDDFSTAKINFTADVNSISTKNDQRDGHLKSDDFFSAEKFPTITFTANGMEKTGDENYKLHGNLTMHGVTKPVALDVEYGGTLKDPYGNIRAGFEVNGKINRTDFGLTYNAALEAGGVVLGEDVTIHANVEFIKQQVAQTA